MSVLSRCHCYNNTRKLLLQSLKPKIDDCVVAHEKLKVHTGYRKNKLYDNMLCPLFPFWSKFKMLWRCHSKTRTENKKISLSLHFSASLILSFSFASHTPVSSPPPFSLPPLSPHLLPLAPSSPSLLGMHEAACFVLVGQGWICSQQDWKPH